MGLFHADDLDDFVAECDDLGGLGDPAVQPFLADFRLEFDTVVDQDLDPFSEAYFEEQVELYTELSGRTLDQESGEMTTLDVDAHAAAISPCNIRDARFLSKHTRAVLTCVMLADLPREATVLDAGSGWGLSSEAIARCGASVTAVDINPLFVELVRRRAARLGLPIESVRSGFDTFHSDRAFDLLMFYECLHHSLKPWETLAHLGRFLKPAGKVIFAGEPVNAQWWKHWGLRLDPLSVYCMRKFGWWESGWTGDFIGASFARAGFALTIHSHIGLDNGLIGTAVRTGAVPPPHFDFTVLEPLRRAAEAEQYAAELAVARHTIAGMQSSRSWRVTAPMRSLFRTLGLART